MKKPTTRLINNTNLLNENRRIFMTYFANWFFPGAHSNSLVHDYEMERDGIKGTWQLMSTIPASFAKSFYGSLYGTWINSPASYYKPHEGNQIQHCFINASASNCGNAFYTYRPKL